MTADEKYLKVLREHLAETAALIERAEAGKQAVPRTVAARFEEQSHWLVREFADNRDYFAE